MMHNDNMKRILIITFLCLFCAQTAFAVPNYNPNQKPQYYSASKYDSQWNKLNEQFDKKHIIKQTATKTVYDDVCFSYNKEVVIPYWDHVAKHQEQIKQQNPELYKKMYGINY